MEQITFTMREVSAVLRVDPASARKWLRMNLDFPAAINENSRPKRYDAAEVIKWFVEHNMRKRGAGGGGDVLDLNAEKARLAKAQADEKEMILARARGEVLERGAAVQALAAAVLTAKNILRSAHAKCADVRPDLPPEVIETIRLAHHEALESLSQAALPQADAPKLRKRKGRPRAIEKAGG